MSLSDLLVAIVALDDAAFERRAAGLRAAGATVRGSRIGANDLVTIGAARFDAVLLEAGADPARFAALASMLGDDPRLDGVPVVLVLDRTTTLDRLRSLGGPYVVLPDSDEQMIVSSLAKLVARARRLAEAKGRVLALEQRLRMAIGKIEALGHEARTLSHDARVLCGVILGYGANLRDEIVGPLVDMQVAHVARVLEAANDLTVLLDRFAAATRVQTSADIVPTADLREQARRQLADIAEMVRATARLFENVAAQKEVTLHVDAPDGISAWCDPMQLKQVIVNLLVNAIKFTPAGGSVTAVARVVAPPNTSGVSARKHAEIVVRDTGPGIPPSDRERVFTRGVRLERDAGVPGTGMGLAVVRDIVMRHGGSVRAEEGPDGGAELVVTLPLDMRTRGERPRATSEEGRK